MTGLRHLVQAAAVAVVAVSVCIGCGGSGKTVSQSVGTSSAAPASPQSPPSKAQFISQADAICTVANGRVTAQQATVNSKLHDEQANDTTENRQALGEALNRDAEIAQPLLDKLRALEPPAGDRVVVAKYLSGVASQISLVRQLATAIENNDSQSAGTLAQQLQQGKASVQGLAQGYGFKVCGSNS